MAEARQDDDRPPSALAVSPSLDTPNIGLINAALKERIGMSFDHKE
jgi:hypothetical protein